MAGHSLRKNQVNTFLPEKPTPRRLGFVEDLESDDIPELQLSDLESPAEHNSPRLRNGRSSATIPDTSFISGIFNIDSKAYDVELTERALIWSVIGTKESNGPDPSKANGTGGTPEKKAKSFSLKKGKDKSSNEVAIRDIFGCTLRRVKNSHSKGDGLCKGVQVHALNKQKNGRLRYRLISLDHPSEVNCNEWKEKIDQALDVYVSRPKKVKLYISLTAGDHKGRKEYLEHVEPLFMAANMEVDYFEIGNEDAVRNNLAHTDLSDFDAVVVCGGDGTVTSVINEVLLKTQKDNSVKLEGSFVPVKAPIPIGILPVGTTNHVAHTMLTETHLQSAALHIITGYTIPVDICSVSNEEKFLQFSFNAHYGFGASVLSFVDRYKSFGAKRIQMAFVKALTKAKLRPYGCEIQYILSPTAGISHPLDGVNCRAGCTVCQVGTADRSSSVYTDSLQDFDPLSISGTSSTIADLSRMQETGLMTAKGDYMNISLFSIPGHCDVAPRGLSKSTHLSDGCMDLILVKQVEKKELLRYLRRHSNSKDQFDFPFVDVFRVKEVRFHPRLPRGWQFKDYGFSEINYEMQRRELQASSEDSLEVVDDLQGKEFSDDSADSDIDLDDEATGDRPQSVGSVSSRGSKASDITEIKFPGDPGYVAPIKKMTELDKLRVKRKAKEAKKEMKRKEKANSKTTSGWSLDNTLHTQLDITFRVHSQLVSLFGRGYPADADFDDSKFGCLPGII